MALAAPHRHQWVAAAPLWQRTADKPSEMQSPTLLCFKSDTFMDDLAAVLDKQPSELAKLEAEAKSYRARPAGAGIGWEPPDLPVLKLYQPVHGHFYLVAANLVCRLPGLPDRVVDTANQEQAGFVLRRIGPNGEELAWVANPTSGKGWQTVSAEQQQKLQSFEELFPLFPVNFRQDERRRRLLVGLVPTSSRESFQAAPSLSPIAVENDRDTKQPKDPRMDEFNPRIYGPLETLTTPTGSVFGQPTQEAKEQLARQQQEASLFLLLDFAEWLDAYLNDLWNAIVAGAAPGASNPKRAVYDRLNTAKVDPSNGPNWREALAKVWAERDRINGESTQAPTITYNLAKTNLDRAALRTELMALLKTVPLPAKTLTQQAQPNTALVPKLDARPGVGYVIRCVYKRPPCSGMERIEVSQPTRQFEIAPFFDFDAPTRPLRITMPADTSIAGLRKFNKNVAFMISDKLRSQMNSVVDLKKAMDGNLAAGESFDLGVICSFSIPIITICALIVLLIFIFLLNIVFWWIPFFRICFPVSFKAK